jgi:2-oxoglutarate ferredoxin oxidoreductase subunit alpha
VTGSISYDPDNHDRMVRLRAQKVANIAADIPELQVDDADGDARTLVLGWGSPYGPIGAAVRAVRQAGHKVASAHLHYLNPFPRNTGEVLRRYDKVLIPEMNTGQLLQLIRAEFLVDAVGYNRVRGLPFRSAELADVITAMVEA